MLLGLLEPKDADAQATRVSDWLLEDAVPCEMIRADAELGPATVEAIRTVIALGAYPPVSVEAAAALTIDARFRLLAGLATLLETRKVVFLSRRPGLVVGAAKPPSVVSLATDTDWCSARSASRGQALLLRQIKGLLEQVPHSMGVTVVNPLQFLRELFTINGAGTLDPPRLAHRRARRVGSRSTRRDCARCSPRPSAATSATISSPARSRAPSSRRTTEAPRSSPRPRWRPT